MMKTRWKFGTALALFVLGCAATAAADQAEGPRGSQTLEHEGELVEGRLFDLYSVEVEPGHHLICNLRSLDFDTYLSVIAPDGGTKFNDDWNQNNQRSYLHLISEQGGRYGIRVAGYSTDEVGTYKLSLFTGQDSPDGSLPPIQIPGELAEGDAEVEGAPGRLIDRIPISVDAGRHVTIELESFDFDTYLILESADGTQRWENDDFRNNQDLSKLALTLETGGAYIVSVTSFEAEESGAYDLLIRQGAAPPKPIELKTNRYTGELAEGDIQRKDGEWADRYEFDGVKGELVTIDLRSTEFDTFVQLVHLDADNRTWENDDYETGNANHSQIKLTLPESGRYAVVATSYDKDEQGKYQLSVSHLPPRDDELIKGELIGSDAKRSLNQHIDWIDLATEPGQQVEVRLASDAFDTYLILESPSGLRAENDDWYGSKSESRVSIRVEEAGVYRIGASSFAAEQTGAYTVDVLITPAPDAGTMRAVKMLKPGEVVEGELMFGDATLDYGELVDRYRFSANEGQAITLDLKSKAFDTFLKIIAPDGSEIINDDFDGVEHSQINLIAEQTGVYRVYAACFDADVAGKYKLELTLDQPKQVAVEADSEPRVYGLFVGISNYGGLDDLPFCAEDAKLLHRRMRDDFGMRAEDAMLLVDSKATVENVEAALTQLTERATPQDTVVIYYSGHGIQLERENFDAQDPDALDEALTLVDGDLTDDRFAELITDLKAHTALFVFDACYAGGFAKDLIIKPGRMGLFSSEEDVLSMVAEKFEAGGYLSRFVNEATGEHRDNADLNGDQILTAHELSHYVSRRFAEELRESKPRGVLHEGLEVDPSVDLSFQKLVTDRGGVSPNHAILAWE